LTTTTPTDTIEEQRARNKMRWFHYNEPGEDGLNRVVKISEQQILTQMKSYHKEYQTRNISDQEIILDFCALHWAFEIEEE
jgi:hypothetical protein